MILNNIWRCKECKLHLIAEERFTHECIEVQDERTDQDGIKWISDGQKWYPLRLNQPTGNTYKNNSRGNSTSKQYSYKVLVPYHTV